MANIGVKDDTDTWGEVPIIGPLDSDTQQEKKFHSDTWEMFGSVAIEPVRVLANSKRQSSRITRGWRDGIPAQRGRVGGGLILEKKKFDLLLMTSPGRQWPEIAPVYWYQGRKSTETIEKYMRCGAQLCQAQVDNVRTRHDPYIR